ncbi:MAG: 50S ribosomal protein L29 [Gammaproteobacteria bacterium]|jgi:large subunit ribosomal protein L29|nr:50S ribosomal protein L29 [Gammaproteobacteria bacterium]
MKASDLRQQSAAELEKQLHELLREQFNLRMQRGVGQLTRPSEMKAGRRNIARIKTVLTEMKADR